MISSGSLTGLHTGIPTLGRCLHRRIPANNRLRKALHFLELRAELQQHKINARGFELRDPFRHLFRCPN